MLSRWVLVSRGGNKPLSEAVISKAAAGSGLEVPMPTCANAGFNPMDTSKRNNIDAFNSIL
jgi:hypothetical protein